MLLIHLGRATKKEIIKNKLMETKVLCKQVSQKILEKDILKYLKIVSKPKCICKKCGRVAKKAKYLCKGEKIKTVKEDAK